MSSSKKPNKVRLDDKSANVKPPWQAWYHAIKNKTFYTNTITNESIWEHPYELNHRSTPSSSTAPPKSRKRKENAKNLEETKEDERMEVDSAPSKRRSEERSTEDGAPTKRLRTTNNMATSEEKRTQIKSSGISQDKKILPIVSWSSKVRGFNRTPYRACAIYDTCALIENSNVLNDSVSKGILTVIPYAVLTELDGLKNTEKTRRKANEVSSLLKTLQDDRNLYLHVETSAEQQIEVDGFHSNEVFKDDVILKCALRIKCEVLSLISTLNLNELAILLVTNDSVLSNKAMAHGLTAQKVSSFLDTINGIVKKPEKSARRSSSREDSRSNNRKSEDREKSRTDDRKRNDRRSENRQSSEDYRRSLRRSEDREKSYSDYKSERRERSVPCDRRESGASRSYDTHVAVQQIKQQRNVKNWIMEMNQKDASRHVNVQEGISKSIKKSNEARPSIPLSDEFVPTPPVKNARAPRPYNASEHRKSYVKPEESRSIPERNRPQMPFSLSDDENEGVEENGMDCT